MGYTKVWGPLPAREIFTIDANAYAGSYTKIFMFETPMKIEEANGGPYHTQLLYNNKDQDVVMKDKITHDYVSYDDELQVKGIMGSTIKKPSVFANELSTKLIGGKCT
ncbi:hypothetical protein ACFE04_028623 [Oxalis oulophora]